MSLSKVPTTYVDLLTPTSAGPAPSLSIAEIASTNGSFDILVAALDAAGLTQTFLDPGDFTVFAPTDAAFTELAENTFGINVGGLTETQIATQLVTTLGVATLTDVLTYHVRPGSATLQELQQEGTISTLLAGSGFDVSGNTLVDLDPDVENPGFVDGLTDIAATNGVIQVIDRVLLPIDVAETTVRPTIADVATSNTAFEALTAALVATGLDAVVADRDADFTVFAPTDDAFRDFATTLGLDVSAVSDAGLAAELVTAVGADLVTDVLLYHVSAGSQMKADLQSARIVDTAFEGAQLGIKGNQLIDLDPEIVNARLITGLTDIETANGTIQAIDKVLVPLDLAPSTDMTVTGSSRSDTIFGGGANDMLSGRDRADVINAGAGNDVLKGGNGNDVLIGGDGNDRSNGGSGRDVLVDGAGNDAFWGRGGADAFDFRAMEGHNVVRDFSSEDTLVFSLADFTDEAAVLAAVEVRTAGIRIENDDGGVLLRDVTTLTVDDFILA